MTERKTVSGICRAVTPKAVLLHHEIDGSECWYPLRHVRVLSGNVGRGVCVELSVPLWLYQKTQQPDLTPTKSRSGIPSDVMRRLIQLCHPDKHGGSETATKATEWLLANR